LTKAMQTPPHFPVSTIWYASLSRWTRLSCPCTALAKVEQRSASMANSCSRHTSHEGASPPAP
jgi:hypothetical protein